MWLFNKKIIGTVVFIAVFVLVTGAATSAINGKEDNSPKTSKDDNKSTNQIALDKFYENRGSKFSIKYPSDWIYDNTEEGSVLFSGKKGTAAYYSTVNIQTVLSKKSGGEYKSIDDIIADVREQVLKESPKANFLAHGPFSLIQPDGSSLKGEYLTFIYTYEGSIIEQWQIVVPRQDGLVFYTWAYTAPIEMYGDYLDIAKAMLATWAIN
ncbi:hypothetical protein AQUSIP_09520 [Aquicella siphonis]|uniref:PsbP C-terminal domain-containing protein n=1 Tax=Aquicella siphonis TaxID=254247 RepID=A0A5E4PGQ7_9COXI|nr:PsbP-related protein [Aquicella siphonis]VVC75662.1 hypothetical protein AQUSIP_09520 [Aquicella siphonis]